jgi:hypothetical protein
MMRAPDKPLRAGWFDETQRQRVKDSLAAAGIVAGDTMVNNLQGFAAIVLAQGLLPGGRLPTAKQQADELRKALALSEQVAAFNSSVTAALAGVRLGDALTDDMAKCCLNAVCKLPRCAYGDDAHNIMAFGMVAIAGLIAAMISPSGLALSSVGQNASSSSSAAITV